MTRGTWFWLIYVICLIFTSWAHWPNDWHGPGVAANYGSGFVVFVLFFLVGWELFGFPVSDSGPSPPRSG